LLVCKSSLFKKVLLCLSCLCILCAVQLSHLEAFFPGAAGPSSSAAAAAAARQTADMVAEFERHQQVITS
jgi:hypothetical protein